jgi:hypothetical protein
MTKKEILEMHFGSDFHEIEQPCYLTHIENAMEEYAKQQVKLSNISVVIKSVCDDFMPNFSDTDICLWCEHPKKEHR